MTKVPGYPIEPVGLELGLHLLDMEELATISAVVARGLPTAVSP
jgi:hypothetical protein